RDQLTGFDLDRHVIHGQPVHDAVGFWLVFGRNVVLEADVVVDDLASYRGRVKRDGSGSVRDFLLQVQVFEDAVEERQGSLDIDVHVQKLAERHEEPALQRGEGHDATNGHAGITTGNRAAGHPVDQRGC